MFRATLPNAKTVGSLPWQRPADIGTPEPPVNAEDEVSRGSKPYEVQFGWCRSDGSRFATFDEALAFRNDYHPDGKIINRDRADLLDDWDDDGRQGMSDGLTDEERERAL